jgi:hypothetical protein
MDAAAFVLLGGALVGLAYAGLRLLTGRMISGSAMIASLLGGREGLAAASIAFIAGLFIAPSILITLAAPPPQPAEPGWLPLVAGGLLVGLGSRLGDGGLVRAIGGLLQGSRWAAGALLAITTGVVGGLFLIRELVGGGGT